MAIALATSVQATNDTSVVLIDSPSITAPAGSRLWVFSGWDSNGVAYSVSNSGANLGWTIVYNGNEASNTGGDLVIAYANVGAGGFTGTVRVEKMSPNFDGCSIWVGAFTGGEATPAGAIVKANGIPPSQQITTTKAGSIIISSIVNWTGGAFGTGVGWTNAGSTQAASQTELQNHRTAGQYQHVCWRRNGTLPIGTYTMDLDDAQIGDALGGDFVTIELREGFSGPTVTLELWENGSLKQTLGTTEVSADGVVSYTWDAATLTAISGANVELRITSSADVDIGAIEWITAETSGPPPVVALVESWGMILI